MSTPVGGADQPVVDTGSSFDASLPAVSAHGGGTREPSAAIVRQAVAGAGKTYWLVQRYLELVLDGAALAPDGRTLRPAHLPVITFTEAAGRELVDRVRAALEGVAAGSRAVPDPSGGNDRIRAATEEEMAAASSALEELPAAPIGTIHAFARRVLMEHAVRADLPYGAEVLDEVPPVLARRMEQEVRALAWRLGKERPIPAAFRWRPTGDGRRQYLDAEGVKLLSSVSPALLRAPSQQGFVGSRARESLESAWQALQRHAQPGPGELTAGQMRPLVEELLAALRENSSGDSADAYEKRIAPATDYLRQLELLAPDEPATPRAKAVGNLTWATKPMLAKLDEGAARAIERICAHAELMSTRLKRAHEAWALVAGWLAVTAYLGVREGDQAEDVLQDELLFTSLGLVLEAPEAAEALRARYPVVLLDEAQDVDATQMELLLELVGQRMTVVGDPQQSIYGFRGADVATFAALAARLGAEPEPSLTTRRCHPVVVEAVNAAFGGVGTFTQLEALRADEGETGPSDTGLSDSRMTDADVRDDVRDADVRDAARSDDSLGDSRLSDAAFRDDRTDGAGRPPGGSALVLAPLAVEVPSAEPDGEVQKPKAPDYQHAQADAIADVVVEFLNPAAAGAVPCLVQERDGSWRPAEPRDIAILVPGRPAVRTIEKALRRRQVPVNVRPSREIARHPAAEGLAAAVFAIADTEDTRSLLLALRSPLFACTDAEITAYVLAAGSRLSLWLEVPEGDPRVDGPVARALAELRRARGLLQRSGAAVALDALAASTALAAGLAVSDGDGWTEGWAQTRRLRAAVAERERTTTESTASLLAWLAEQIEVAGNTNSTVLHEPQAQAVTITTIHQAKGLEWPVVVMAALSRDDDKKPKLAFDDTGTLQVHLAKGYTTREDEPRDPHESEVLRKLYVAMTRARDHVVVSTLAPAARSMPGPLAPGALARAFEESEDGRIRSRAIEVRPGQGLRADPIRYRRRSAASAGPGDVEARLAAVAAGAGRVLRRESPSSLGHDRQSAMTRNPATAGGATDTVDAPNGGGGSAGAGGGEAAWAAVAAAGSPLIDQAPEAPVPAAMASSFAGSSSSASAAVGTFVHEVLAEVDLAAFTDSARAFDDVAGDALARTLATIGDAGVDLALVRTMLGHARGSEVLARAGRSARVRVEVPVSTSRIEQAPEPGSPDVEVVVTGSIDLLFDDANTHGAGPTSEAEPGVAPRWVLVDHKTDTTGKPQADFVAGYAPQLAAYEALLAELGVEVAEKWLVRITPHGVTDVRVG